MKKIFSILALLLLLVAFYPQKVEANVKQTRPYSYYDIDTWECSDTGGDCIQMKPIVIK